MYFGRIDAETNPRVAIYHLRPHYTDGRFRDPQTVYLATGYQTTIEYSTPIVKGLSYDYSDRIRQWDLKKADAAWSAAAEKFEKYSAAMLEAYLRGFFDDPDLKLIHVVAGVNHSNGYDYQIFGYIRGKLNEPPQEQP